MDDLNACGEQTQHVHAWIHIQMHVRTICMSYTDIVGGLNHSGTITVHFSCVIH